MSNQRQSLIFSLLFICFFRESFCICDGTIWTKVGWEILPEEVHYWKVTGSPSHHLPYLLDKLCCHFANMDIFQGCLYLIYNLLQAVFFILFFLSVHYLWTKWKKHQKKLKNQASLEKPGNDLDSPFINNIDQTLHGVATTSSVIYKILGYHPSSKKIKHCKLKKSKEEGARRY
ncbi:testis-expressed protein 50 [Nomascus leucogenys]|uniref:Testis expressed 50 n=1 Tax=Nomascus leucogenys TaxID=61853 RepID=G1RZ84_NOMLE|nr:testis-expressed protein 50 [Nomascus leucogenys]